MVNHPNSSVSRKCKPAKIKHIPFYGRDAMVYTCCPPSYAAGFSRPLRKTHKSERRRNKHKSDLTHVSKGGKLLGYLGYDSHNPERGLYMMTMDGIELDPLQYEKRKGLGYIWTEEHMAMMLHRNCHERPEKNHFIGINPYYQKPTMIYDPRLNLCPSPPQIIAPPPQFEAVEQPHLSNGKVSFGRSAKSLDCESDDRKPRSSPSYASPSILSPHPVSVYSPGPEPYPSSFHLPCPEPYTASYPPPYHEPYHTSLPPPGQPQNPASLPPPGQPPYPASLTCICRPPCSGTMPISAPTSSMCGIPVHFLPHSKPPIATSSSSYPTSTKSDAGNQACMVTETYDRGVEATTVPSELAEICDGEQTRENKMKEPLKLITAEKKETNLENGCPLDTGPCSSNEAKTNKRYLAFLRGSNRPSGQRGYIEETKYDESLPKEKKETYKETRSVSTQCERFSLSASTSKSLLTSPTPNTSQIVVLRRSPTSSPLHDNSKKNIAFQNTKKRPLSDDVLVKNKVLSNTSNTENPYQNVARNRKWYFDGFRQPAPKEPKCVIS